MKPAVHDGITFGPYRISPSERMLRRGETVIPLPPKVIETLLALAEQPGRVVDKTDLLERVWPNTLVEEGGLARNISVLRRTLGVTADGKPSIETVPRRGYRFVANVSDSVPAEEEAGTLGVLPLRILSADATDESLADGMTDALINYFLQQQWRGAGVRDAAGGYGNPDGELGRGGGATGTFARDGAPHLTCRRCISPSSMQCGTNWTTRSTGWSWRSMNGQVT